MFWVSDWVVIQKFIFCHNDYLTYIPDILVMHLTQWNLFNIKNFVCETILGIFSLL